MYQQQGHICGLYLIDQPDQVSRHFSPWELQRRVKYLPRVSLSVHAQIIGTTSRTLLTQTFVNPSRDAPIPELRYTFPLYDGVSVVGFVCTINKDRVIRGLVKERAQARKDFKDAVDRGKTAGLLEQLPAASDVFTTTIGNVPAGAEIKVEITYLGELKQDAETDGIRFTIPTSIAPRYGDHGRGLLTSSTVLPQSGIKIIVDAEMPDGSNIKAIQSPSHPIAVTIGNTSVSADSDMSLQRASATLALGSAELDKDFVVHVVATNTSEPVALLETHPTIPNQRALMATLVPKFNLPQSRPEIVFVCDRSGSMDGKIPNLKAALHIFLKSLPVGVKFNICSFGSRYEFLFKDGSRSYDDTSLEEATRYVNTFRADFGGTEMYQPVEQTFKKRFKDMGLEVFLLTDGEIWDQGRLFTLINDQVAESKGRVRVFTLGIGENVSHSLIEGVARAGNGFAQTVGDQENMTKKVVRMLKASLSPHVTDYTLEIKYGNSHADAQEEDDFEIIEKVKDSLNISVPDESDQPAVPAAAAAAAATPISLFDKSADPDTEMVDVSLDQSAGGKYAHVPPVPEPKILQAPFQIPALYAFSRTSVYLLLSASSPQKTIKSVVLRGTCAHGPLKLEIPVTVLPQKGETIHQLAARKAIKELEEGRGWLFHAKDAEEPGKLLKDKFEGRFSDMVEREAVRLGVALQVGGKWCSFVAVEGDSEKPQDPDQPVRLAESASDISQATLEPPAVSYAYMLTNSAFGSGRGSAPRATSMLAMPSPSPPPPPPPAAAPMAPGLGQFPGLISKVKRSFASPSAAAPRAAPPPPARSGRFPKPASPSQVDSESALDSTQCMSEEVSPPQHRARKVGTQPSFALESPLSRTAYRDGRAPEFSLASDESDSTLTDTTRDVFESLVSLQSAAGFWVWSDKLLGALKLDGADQLNRKLAPLQTAYSSSGQIFQAGTDLLATALVVAFLEKMMADLKEEWEMLGDKARGWMDGQLKGVMSAGELVEKVKAVL